VLLALNPVFILTSTSAVAEPLLVLFLLAAVAAAQARRLGLATAFACLACLTGTKAWLWLGCLVLVVGAEWLIRSRARAAGTSGGTYRRLAWVVPALALALAMQAVFGFASHSVARAAVEAGSAAARGDLATSPLVRGGQFVGYFALASLPTVALAPFGLVAALRGRAADNRALVTVALPSLLFLAVVTALVVMGVYTGSHRYYYPALPGLALAAAAAADRLRVPYALLPAVGAVVVAIGFVPVLNGLAADNRGLRQAGESASALPGGLLTDSPAAAYWSHKAPDQIYGSRALPTGRQASLDWMRSRGVGGLVLENVDYYRATAVLPDLVTGATGQAARPFTSVGAGDTFVVPGGKDVHVYTLGRTVVGIAPGLGVTADQAGWPGRGKTAELAKGPVLTGGGQDQAGEGMGFGVPIAQFADGWWFGGPDSGFALMPDGRGWTITYNLDRREVDDARGGFLRFEAGPSHGQVQVTYRVRSDGLRVQVRVQRLDAGAKQVVLLNEESGAFDDYADARTTRLGDAIGSLTPVSGDYARFRSAALGSEWEVPAPPRPSGFSAEHEVRAGIDFSGLEWTLGPDLRSVDYTVSIRRAK
jgi:hypothetical protein